MRSACGGLAAIIGSIFLPVASAHAGPPYVTDDPEPTDRGHWEVYGFASGMKIDGETEGEAGLDLNYGAAKDLQLTAVIPADFGSGETGLGDVEIAAKRRLLHQSTRLPDLALFPQLTLPTGGRRFGERRPTLFLPIWAQKDFGPWSVFGGGGYRIRPGAGRPDVWETGVAASRAVGERLQLGLEAYHQTPEEHGGGAFTGLNIGGAYRMTDRWSVLFSGGPGLQNRRQGRFRFYLGLKADY
jgi:hypothetical protein